MSSPFLGQLLLVGFNFAPISFLTASGQLLSISQYTALFSLLGTFYGGNGISTFALPNLQGNVAVGAGQLAGGSVYDQGETGGSSTVTLLSSETPNHTHSLLASGARGNVGQPGGNSLADAKDAGSLYSSTAAPVANMAGAALSTFGSAGPHNNMMPFLALNWIICTAGIYPSRG